MAMGNMKRRQFMKFGLGSFVTYSLLGLADATSCLAASGRDLLAPWLRDLDTLCKDLRAFRLTPKVWQERMAVLYQGVQPDELMRFIDFEDLVTRLSWPETGAAIGQVRFPEVEGFARPSGWASKIFALEKGRAVVPHAHNNMVSAHFVLDGSFHVRTYNRRFDLEREPGYLFLEPSLDTTFQAGELLTMSDSRDNVHWLVAESERAFTLDIPVTDLIPGRAYPTPANPYGMIFIDPPEISNDDIKKARIIDVGEALARFG